MSKAKRITKLFFFIVCFSVVILLILNISVTSKQGINYVVRTIEMPLYIKIIEFFDRDYHYRELVSRVCRGYHTPEDKVLALFKWTHQNIKTDIPQGWPIIDDHVWSIIVRGYGVMDQLSDVFTTLCNYAGADAFYTWIYSVDKDKRIAFSLVKIEEKWRIFDPYNGNYFKNENGELADIEELTTGRTWFTESLDGKSDINYAVYIDNLPLVSNIGLTRANIQSPLNRLLFELKRLK